MAEQNEDKKKSNIKAVGAFRLKGETIQVGQVVSKSDFPSKQAWQNLCHMSPKPRAEETSDPVGKPKAQKADKPDAGKAGSNDAQSLPGTGGKS